MILILYYCSFVVEKNPVDRPAGERGGIRNVIVGTLLMPVERRPCEGLCHILILYYYSILQSYYSPTDSLYAYYSLIVL